MGKSKKTEEPAKIQIHLPADIVAILQRIADEEMRDRKTQIQKILIDYAKAHNPDK